MWITKKFWEHYFYALLVLGFIYTTDYVVLKTTPIDYFHEHPISTLYRILMFPFLWAILTQNISPLIRSLKKGKGAQALFFLLIGTRN